MIQLAEIRGKFTIVSPKTPERMLKLAGELVAAARGRVRCHIQPKISSKKRAAAKTSREPLA